jgi:thioredoxin-like negative regulator of GroEL
MQLLEFDAKDFDQQRLKRSGRFAVMFAAQWCGFCQAFKPTFLSSLANQDLQLALVDLSDWENQLWEVFDVKVIPTVVCFVDGKIIVRKDGKLGVGLSAADMRDLLDEFGKAKET